MQPSSRLEKIREKIKELSKVSPNLLYTPEELERKRKMLESKPFLFNSYCRNKSSDYENTTDQLEPNLKGHQIKFTQSSKFSDKLRKMQADFKKDEDALNFEQKQPVNKTDKLPLGNIQKENRRKDQLRYLEINSQSNPNTNLSNKQEIKSTSEGIRPQQQNIKPQNTPPQQSENILSKQLTQNVSISPLLQTNMIQVKKQASINNTQAKKDNRVKYDQMPPIQDCNPIINPYNGNPQCNPTFQSHKQIRIFESIIKKPIHITFPTEETKIGIIKQELNFKRPNQNIIQSKQSILQAKNQKYEEQKTPISQLEVDVIKPSTIFHRTNIFPIQNRKTVPTIGSTNNSQFKQIQRQDDKKQKQIQPLEIEKINIFDKKLAPTVSDQKKNIFGQPAQKTAKVNIFQDLYKPKPSNNIFKPLETNIFKSSANTTNLFTSKPQNIAVNNFPLKNDNQIQKIEYPPMTFPLKNVNNDVISLQQVDDQEQMNELQDQKDDNEPIQAEDSVDPSLLTVKYDYVKSQVYFKELATKIKIGNKLINDVTVSLQSFSQNADIYLFLRMSNKCISFTGKLIPKITKVRSFDNNIKNVQILKVLTWQEKTGKSKLASIKVQFSDQQIATLLVKEVQQRLNIQE